MARLKRKLRRELQREFPYCYIVVSIPIRLKVASLVRAFALSGEQEDELLALAGTFEDGEHYAFLKELEELLIARNSSPK